MSIEVQEGIVLWSATRASQIQPVNLGDIVYASDGSSYIDLGDKYGFQGQYVRYGEQRMALSKSYIETLDLLSEGKIAGPITGKYIFSGNLWATGWASATFSGYAVPSGGTGYGWLRSVYWNEVPVLSDRAQFNFQNVQAVATNGLPNGVALETLMSEHTSSRSIGERLRFGSDQVKIYRILNRDCRGCILNVRVNSLYVTDDADASIGRTHIQYKISYRPLFSTQAKLTDFSVPVLETIFGKVQAAGGYIRSTRIEFNTSSYTLNGTTSPNVNGGFIGNSDFLGWEVKVERITEDSTVGLMSNNSTIDSITELYGSKLTYPHSAIVKTKFNAEYFSSVPERAFECNFLEVKIPGNYNPILRTYSGAGFATTNGYWNGEFATGKAWTNNPAWCFYDLMTNKRYGLGRYIDNIEVDKFNLYDIAQYCDQLVPDGEGGIEPRFTCNTWIAGREDAFNVINDLASVFRAMTYYANGNVYTVQDAPKPHRVLFTNANVEDGDFNYSSTSKKSRQSVAIVKYINPRDFYRPATEYVEDIDAIRKYGVREIDLTAFACTSRGQAIRFGRWALLSNNIENETVQFTAGLEAATLRPGDIFKVIDYNKKTKRYGGRISLINDSGSGATVTLDSSIPLLDSSVQYKLSVLTPSYYYDTTQVSGLTSADIPNLRRSFIQEFLFSGTAVNNTGSRAIIQLSTGFNKTGYYISGNPVWSMELGPLSTSYTGSRYFANDTDDLYRTVNINEADANRYQVVGLKYWGGKFPEVDSGILYQRYQIPGLSRTPSSPKDLSLNVYPVTNSTRKIQYAFLVDNFNYIDNYKIFATTGSFTAGIPSSQFLINTLPSNTLQGSHIVSNSGHYSFRVYSFSEAESQYSNTYASNEIDVYTSPSITDISIGQIGTY